MSCSKSYRFTHSRALQITRRATRPISRNDDCEVARLAKSQRGAGPRRRVQHLRFASQCPRCGVGTNKPENGLALYRQISVGCLEAYSLAGPARAAFDTENFVKYCEE